MPWGYFAPYVPVAERRRNAEQAARRALKKGQTLNPVKIEGRAMATTFWGKSWCDNLERYSDFSNRLPRGRSYARNGSIIDLQIDPGKITALVAGSSLYKIKIEIKPLAPARWKALKNAAAGKVSNLLDLLQGRLSKDILTEITDADSGLFPKPSEIKLNCSCPDWADMCKHVAAVLYGVGARLDVEPALFFTLRGVDMQELVSAASAQAAAPIPGATTSKKRALAEADLAGIFGVELDATVPAAALPTHATHIKPATDRKIAQKVAKTQPPKQTHVHRFAAEEKNALLRAWHAEANKATSRSKAEFCRDTQVSVITLNKWLADESARLTPPSLSSMAAVHDTADVDVDGILKQIRGFRTRIDALRARLAKFTELPE